MKRVDGIHIFRGVPAWMLNNRSFSPRYSHETPQVAISTNTNWELRRSQSISFDRATISGCSAITYDIEAASRYPHGFSRRSRGELGEGHYSRPRLFSSFLWSFSEMMISLTLVTVHFFHWILILFQRLSLLWFILKSIRIEHKLLRNLFLLVYCILHYVSLFFQSELKQIHPFQNASFPPILHENDRGFGIFWRAHNMRMLVRLTSSAIQWFFLCEPTFSSGCWERLIISSLDKCR